MFKAKTPMTAEQEAFINNAAKGLAQLASNTDATRFEQVLGALFMRGYARCTSPVELEKNRAGVDVVKIFCEKIENWAGAPMRELAAAKKLTQDGGVVSLKQEKLNATSGLPHFNGYEKDIIRRSYLPDEDRKSMQQFERKRLKRRAFVGTLIAGLAASTAKTIAVSNEELTPAQLKEEQADRAVQEVDKELKQLVVSKDTPEVQAKMSAAFANQREAVKALQQATMERDSKGELPWKEAENSRGFRLMNYSYLTAGLFFALVGKRMTSIIPDNVTKDEIMFEDTSYELRDGEPQHTKHVRKPPPPTDKQLYDKHTATLRDNMLAAASNELLNGADALLENAAQAYAQEQAAKAGKVRA